MMGDISNLLKPCVEIDFPEGLKQPHYNSTEFDDGGGI